MCFKYLLAICKSFSGGEWIFSPKSVTVNTAHYFLHYCCNQRQKVWNLVTRNCHWGTESTGTQGFQTQIFRDFPNRNLPILEYLSKVAAVDWLSSISPTQRFNNFCILRVRQLCAAKQRQEVICSALKLLIVMTDSVSNLHWSEYDLTSKHVSNRWAARWSSSVMYILL